MGSSRFLSWWELTTSNCWDTQHSTDIICGDGGSAWDYILKEFVQKINGDLKHVIWSGASNTAVSDFPFLPSNSSALINAVSISQPHRYSGLLVRYLPCTEQLDFTGFLKRSSNHPFSLPYHLHWLPVLTNIKPKCSSPIFQLSPYCFISLQSQGHLWLLTTPWISFSLLCLCAFGHPVLLLFLLPLHPLPFYSVFRL